MVAPNIPISIIVVTRCVGQIEMVAPNIPMFLPSSEFHSKFAKIRHNPGVYRGRDRFGGRCQGGESSILRRRARWPVSDVDAMSASLIDSLVVSFRPPHH